MDPRKHQPVVTGSTDGFTQAIELVASTFLFALLGWWLDGRLGTAPVLMIVLGALALTANVLKLYFGYVAQMRAEEEGKPWARNR